MTTTVDLEYAPYDPYIRNRRAETPAETVARDVAVDRAREALNTAMHALAHTRDEEFVGCPSLWNSCDGEVIALAIMPSVGQRMIAKIPSSRRGSIWVCYDEFDGEIQTIERHRYSPDLEQLLRAGSQGVRDAMVRDVCTAQDALAA